MPNFYTDNPDIRASLDQLDLAQEIALREGDFGEARQYDYAPRDAAEARRQYASILELTGQICAEFVAPRAKIVDAEGNRLLDGEVVLHPALRESLDVFRDAGLMGMASARRFGGLNLPLTVKTAAIEMVSRADASLMNIVGLQDIAETIEEYAEESVKQGALPRLTGGQDTAAMVLTEPDAGSDLQAVRLRAELEDEATGKWRLSGSKRFITNGCGEVLLVLARSEADTPGARGLSVFLVRKGEGVRIRRIEEKLGIHGSPTCEIQFDRAPGVLVGPRKRGLIDVAMHIMNGARLGIAAQSLGIAEAAARAASDYAKAREQFGKAIRHFPAVYEMLAGMRIRIEAARALTYRAAHVVELLHAYEHRAEAGDAAAKVQVKEFIRLAGVLTPLCKYYTSEMCNRVSDQAIQVLGGSGYMKDYPVERHFRDARITNIYEGTSQLQIVGAIGGVRSGVLRRHLDTVLAAAAAGPAADLAQQVTELLPLLDASTTALEAKKDQELLDLYARPQVDLALDLYLGVLLTQQAGAGDERKRAVAEAYFAEMKPRARETAARISEGSRVLVDGQKAIIDG
jgi:3-(methylthio)propanoyl-CoA dehydrogenase